MVDKENCQEIQRYHMLRHIHFGLLFTFSTLREQFQDTSIYFMVLHIRHGYHGMGSGSSEHFPAIQWVDLWKATQGLQQTPQPHRHTVSLLDGANPPAHEEHGGTIVPTNIAVEHHSFK